MYYFRRQLCFPCYPNEKLREKKNAALSVYCIFLTVIPSIMITNTEDLFLRLHVDIARHIFRQPFGFRRDLCKLQLNTDRDRRRRRRPFNRELNCQIRPFTNDDHDRWRRQQETPHRRHSQVASRTRDPPSASLYKNHYRTHSR